MPPPLPATLPCSHTYAHLETVTYNKDAGYNTQFVRIDRFFCTKCLHTEDRRREGYHRDTPEWFRTDDKDGGGQPVC